MWYFVEGKFSYRSVKVNIYITCLMYLIRWLWDWIMFISIMHAVHTINDKWNRIYVANYYTNLPDHISAKLLQGSILGLYYFWFIYIWMIFCGLLTPRTACMRLIVYCIKIKSVHDVIMLITKWFVFTRKMGEVENVF